MLEPVKKPCEDLLNFIANVENSNKPKVFFGNLTIMGKAILYFLSINICWRNLSLN
jgi:hypothetical protein